MVKITNTEVFNIDGAMRGMRNPLDSWHLNDTILNKETGLHEIGPNDLKLAKSLRRAGSDHRKFLRQIVVSADFDLPLYIWKELDTYKVGTTANSCSTMHTIHKKPFTMDMFSVESLSGLDYEVFDLLISRLEALRKEYLESKNKTTWRNIIQMLPSSFNQMRTVTLNYEVLLNIYNARKNHKLKEWLLICMWIESLPYFEEICMDIREEV